MNIIENTDLVGIEFKSVLISNGFVVDQFESLIR